jgi:cyclopropane-fatty-acyl-phospholipid synthase
MTTRDNSASATAADAPRATTHSDRSAAISTSTYPRGLAGRLLRQLDAAGVSAIRIRFGSGPTFTAGHHEAGVVVPHLHVRRLPHTLWRSWANGLLGWAEAFMAGDWDSDELVQLTDWGLHNESRLNAAFTGTRISQWLNRLWHRMHANSKRGSRRNIAYHYDLGNDFYRQWLDPSMTYSAACFSDPEQGDPEQSLEAAQRAKYQRIFTLAEIEAGHRVLEIGCGWGGFAELVAQRGQIDLDGVTLSGEQLHWARQRIAASGGAERVQLHFCDYRDIQGRYDRIVSIEMFEAVGEEHWQNYFEVLQRCLKPGGVAVLQIICIEPARFESYRTQTDFIQRYVFPGGMLPTTHHIAQLSRANGLELEEEHSFGQDYARTLATWRDNFTAAWPQIEPLGYDQHFRRLWEYYLAYCESGFRYKSIDVCHFKIRKPVE